jgi:hypothetical protein
MNRIVQTRTLNHIVGKNAPDGICPLTRRDSSQGTQRRNLLRDRMLKAEALKPPTERLKYWNGGD